MKTSNIILIILGVIVYVFILASIPWWTNWIWYFVSEVLPYPNWDAVS